MTAEVVEQIFTDLGDRLSSISGGLETVRARSDPVVEALVASLDAAQVLCAALVRGGGVVTRVDLENALAAVRAMSLAVRFALADAHRSDELVS